MPTVARTLTVLGLLTFAGACDLTPDDRYVGLEGLSPFIVVRSSLSTDATDVALNQPITVEFNQHLDPRSFEYFDAVIVTSGGIAARGFTRYRLTDRTLIFYPTTNLRAGLVYSVSVNPDTVRSLRGEPLAIPFSVTFQTSAEDVTVDQEGRNLPRRSFATDIQPLFEASCASCHGLSDTLVPLDFEALFTDSLQTDPPRALVLPYSPERSYLLHKVLPGYPDRRHTVMPPPWSDVPALTLEEVGLIEEWVLTGAAP